MTLRLYDSRGRLVREQRRDLRLGQGLLTLDAGELASGVYHLRMDAPRLVTVREERVRASSAELVQTRRALGRPARGAFLSGTWRSA